MENQNLNDPSKEQPVDTDQTLLDDQIPSRQYREETASELVDDEPYRETHNREDDEVQNVYGWVAIALSVVSFFWIPLLFAGAGIILGFIARNRDAPVLGNIAIVIGILSILTRLFILPLI